MQISERLQSIQGRIRDPRHWCRGHAATTIDGRETAPDSPDAAHFCLFGAVIREFSPYSWEESCERNSCEVLLRTISWEIFGQPEYIRVNDDLGHAAVMQFLDRAIAAARMREGA